MTAFTDLLASARAERHYLVCLEPYDPGSSGTVALYYSSHGFNSEPGDTPSSQHYSGRLNDPPSFSRALFSDAKLSGRSIPGAGKLVLNNMDGGLDTLRTYAWGGRRVRVWLGGPGFALSDYGLIFDCTAASIQFGDADVTINLRDLQYLFDREIQSVSFAGSGGAEGNADVAGKLKPKCYGIRRNVAPVYVGISGAGYHIFTVHDGPIIGVLKVRDSGLALDFTTSSTPVPGQWTLDVSTGLITLGGAYVRITADVIGARYLSVTSTSSISLSVASKTFVVSAGLALVAGMAVRVARTSTLSATYGDGVITSYSGTSLVINLTSVSAAAGPFTDWTIMPYGTAARVMTALATLMGATSFDTAAASALDAAQPATVGLWLMAGGNGLTALDTISNGSGSFYGFTRAGAFQVGRIVAPSGSVATYDQTQILTLERQDLIEPHYQVTVHYQHNESVMGGADLVGAVSDADRLFLTKEWTDAVATSSACLTKYPLSVPIVVDSVFDDATVAAAEATRLLALYSVRRDYYKTTLKVQPLARDLAQTITLQRDDGRYGLSSGQAFAIVDMTEDLTVNEVDLGVWG